MDISSHPFELWEAVLSGGSGVRLIGADEDPARCGWDDAEHLPEACAVLRRPLRPDTGPGRVLAVGREPHDVAWFGGVLGVLAHVDVLHRQG